MYSIDKLLSYAENRLAVLLQVYKNEVTLILKINIDSENYLPSVADLHINELGQSKLFRHTRTLFGWYLKLIYYRKQPLSRCRDCMR